MDRPASGHGRRFHVSFGNRRRPGSPEARPAVSFRAGEIVGVYKIISPIGSGGVGQVFKAEHTITGRIDAIKVLAAGQPAGQQSPREQAERFVREIRIQASLDHPNIAQVYNAFWESGELVMAMEFVEGESLKRILERG